MSDKFSSNANAISYRCPILFPIFLAIFSNNEAFATQSIRYHNNCCLLQVVVNHLQEPAVLLLVLAGDDGGNAPSCCFNLIVSALIHPSVILPSIIVMNPISSKDSFLPVGGIPWNSSLWVPVTLRRIATFSLSATISTIS